MLPSNLTFGCNPVSNVTKAHHRVKYYCFFVLFLFYQPFYSKPVGGGSALRRAFSPEGTRNLNKK